MSCVCPDGLTRVMPLVVEEYDRGHYVDVRFVQRLSKDIEPRVLQGMQRVYSILCGGPYKSPQITYRII